MALLLRPYDHVCSLLRPTHLTLWSRHLFACLCALLHCPRQVSPRPLRFSSPRSCTVLISSLSRPASHLDYRPRFVSYLVSGVRSMSPLALRSVSHLTSCPTSSHISRPLSHFALCSFSPMPYYASFLNIN